MTLRRLIIAITFLSIFSMAARISMDSDSWWHIATGQWIAENQSVPKVDSFSFTRLGEAWRYPSAAWISQFSMFQLYRLGGPAALNLGVASVVTATFGVLYFALSGGPFLRALILILAAATSSVFWSARPQIATLLFFALFLLVLENFRWGRSTHLYWLFPLMLLWVNSHPGFAAGFILLFIYFLDEAFAVLAKWIKQRPRSFFDLVRKSKIPYFLLLVFLLLMATSVNPSGPSILSYPFETLSIGALREFIQEWQSPNFHDAAMQPFIWTMLLLIVALAYSRKTKTPSEMLLISIFAYMALLAGRNVALFALASAPALSRHLQGMGARLAEEFRFSLDTNRTPTPIQSRMNYSILVIVSLLAVIKVAQIMPLEKNLAQFEKHLPVNAVDYLNNMEPQGRLFNSYNWGGYLIWALSEYPVFVDGRTDLYSDELIGEWLSIVAAEDGWQSILEGWSIEVILLEPHWPLVSALDEQEWMLVNQSEVAYLYIKQ